jgi:hypothetical protein
VSNKERQRRLDVMRLQQQMVQNGEVPIADADYVALPSLKHDEGATALMRWRYFDASFFETRPTYQPPPYHSFVTQFRLLSYRYTQHLVRAPSLVVAHVLGSVLLGLLIGVMFMNISNDIAGANNRFGLFIFCNAYFTFSSLSGADVFIKGRGLIKKEIAAGFYGPHAYYFAKSMTNMVVLRLFCPIIFSVCCYFIIGLRDDNSHFLVFTGILVLMHLIASQTSMIVSLISRTTAQANFSLVIIMLFNICLSPFLFNTSEVSPHNPVKYASFGLSFVRYSFEALCINEFDGLPMIFNPKDSGVFQADGSTYVENLGMSVDALGRDVFVLCCFFAITTLIGALCSVVHSGLTDMNIEGELNECACSRSITRGYVEPSVRRQIRLMQGPGGGRRK